MFNFNKMFNLEKTESETTSKVPERKNNGDAAVDMNPEFKDNSPELKEALEKIDFNLLKDIFKKRIERYIDKGEIDKRFIPKERIRESHAKGNFGNYEFVFKKLGVNIEEINKASANKKVKNLLVLSTICHEETHALSASKHITTEDSDKTYSEFRIGFDKTVTIFNKVDEKDYWKDFNEFLKERNLKQERFFQFFNEGVTNTFALEIMDEYISLKFNVSKEDMEEYKKVESYQENMGVFKSAYQRLAKDLRYDSEFMKNGFYSSMFGGDDLADPELLKQFDEATFPDFSKFYLKPLR